MLSTALTALVEGYAAIDRKTERQRLLALAVERAQAQQKSGKTLVIVKSPEDIYKQLSAMPGNSAVVFVDGALEKCGVNKADLDACWGHVKRVAGTSADVFVSHIQPWSSARLGLDPRVRWVIVSAPPQSHELVVRPYGKRSTVLADERGPRKARSFVPSSVSQAKKVG